jgi:ABC-type glycerol-3-phosphate transport system permease component
VRAKKLTASRFYLGCLGFGIAIAAVILFGFIFMVPVYFIFYTLFLGDKKNLIKVTITALAIAALVYLIFGYFMDIPMTKGLLFG